MDNTLKSMRLHLTDMILNVHQLYFIPQKGYWDSSLWINSFIQAHYISRQYLESNN